MTQSVELLVLVADYVVVVGVNLLVRERGLVGDVGVGGVVAIGEELRAIGVFDLGGGGWVIGEADAFRD